MSRALVIAAASSGEGTLVSEEPFPWERLVGSSVIMGWTPEVAEVLVVERVGPLVMMAGLLVVAVWVFSVGGCSC